jgi:hypothetical protein
MDPMSRRDQATVEFEADADPIRGRVTSANDNVEFVGWLELMALLDRAIRSDTRKDDP